jgi:hypothetical protein
MKKRVLCEKKKKKYHCKNQNLNLNTDKRACNKTEDVCDLKAKKNRSKGVRNCKTAEISKFHSSKEITAHDCFLSATVKIQWGKQIYLLSSL